MKIIILFALASVGVCIDSGSQDPLPPEECSTCEPYVPTYDRCDDFVNKYANDENCLTHALESVPQLLEIAKKLICKHRRNELDKRFVYYAEFEKELRDFLECTGCFAGKILGVKDILVKIATIVANLLGISVEILGELVHNTGFLEPVLDSTCDLLTGEFASKCVEILSNSNLQSKADSLRSISCMARKDNMDFKITIKQLRDIGCRLEDAWENFDDDTGKKLLAPVLNAVMMGLGEGLLDDVLGSSG